LDFLILLLDLHTTKRTLNYKRSLKKNLEQEVQNNPDREVFFFDESRFGTHSRLGHGWFKTGVRTPVAKKLGFNNFIQLPAQEQEKILPYQYLTLMLYALTSS
jgi:hypothetical protein